MVIMLIHTALPEGRELKKEVLEGIINNDCNLMIATNSDAPSERGKAENIKRLLQHFDGEYFIFMDCDVVMQDVDTIEKLKLAMAYHPIVTIPTKRGHTKTNFPDIMPHGICGIRKDFLNIFKEYLNSDGCVYCNFLSVHKPVVLWDMQAYELK